MKVVALVPAYNEQDTISLTIETLLAQTHPVTVVVLPNGCSDNTAEIARQYPVTVMEFPKLKHKKSEAMNKGWMKYCQDADLVITVDADTELMPESVQQWVDEFNKYSKLAGSSARFTMRPGTAFEQPENISGIDIVKARMKHQNTNFLVRLQRMDFSMGIDISLRRGWTCVLAGAASCFRNDVLNQVYMLDDREGPWTYESAVEDFEVTYQCRRLGYKAWVSPEVRAYTDAMKTWKALRGQRMKWNTGTIEDLMKFGVNKTTYVMWAQQLLGWAGVLILAGFFTLVTYTAVHHAFHIHGLYGWTFSVGIPGLVWLKNIKHSWRIPHRDKWDVAMAMSILTYEVFSWIRMSWFIASWRSVLWEKITKKKKDRWEMQYASETAVQKAKRGIHAHVAKHRHKKVLAKTP